GEVRTRGEHRPVAVEQDHAGAVLHRRQHRLLDRPAHGDVEIVAVGVVVEPDLPDTPGGVVGGEHQRVFGTGGVVGHGEVLFLVHGSGNLPSCLTRTRTVPKRTVP